MRASLRSAFALIAAALLVTGVAAPAHATAVEDEQVANTVPMYVAYYDHKVAKENGFKIRTDANGSEYAVAVTEKAKKLMADHTLGGGITTYGTVNGPCGSSTLLMARDGSERVEVGTQFRVIAATLFHVWNVDLTSSRGKFSKNFDGGPTGGTWNAIASVYTGTSYGVKGVVRAGSYAFLVTGAVCYSGSPTAGT